MKISELIMELQRLKEEEGDLEVTYFNSNGISSDIHSIKPTIEYSQILRKREKRTRYWYQGQDENLKGDKLVRL